MTYCSHRHRALLITPGEHWAYQMLCKICMTTSLPAPTGTSALVQWFYEREHDECREASGARHLHEVAS